MAQTGAQKGCCGPFAAGVDTDACGCTCKLCPPDCCDTAILHYELGEPSDPDCCSSTTPAGPAVMYWSTYTASQWSSTSKADWLVLPVDATHVTMEDLVAPDIITSENYLDFLNKQYGVTNNVNYSIIGENMGAIPEFSSAPIKNNGFIQSMSSGNCSIPCIDVTITVSISYCCLIISGGGLTSVGQGQVSASVSPSSAGDCGTLSAQINGSSGSVWVDDNTSINISLVISGGICPCASCLISVEDPCASAYAMKMYRGIIKTRSSVILQLNTSEIKRKLQKVANSRRNKR